jgi:hypothetical protein
MRLDQLITTQRNIKISPTVLHLCSLQELSLNHAEQQLLVVGKFQGTGSMQLWLAMTATCETSAFTFMQVVGR